MEDEKEENGEKRKSSDQNKSNGNKRRKYEPTTTQGFSAEQHVKLQLQLSQDRIKQTEITHTETTKRRKYTINKIVETGKILLHNIKSIEKPADTSASGEEDNKSESDEDSDYEDDGGK